MAGWSEWRRLNDRRVLGAAAGAGAVLLLGGSGLAAVSAASHPEPASAGRLVSFQYATVRTPRYTPPPPTEEARLDVRPPASLYGHVEVLSPEADSTWRAMQAEDAGRMATALAEVRASDRRLDRELSHQLRETRARYERPAEFVLSEDEDEEPEPGTKG